MPKKRATTEVKKTKKKVEAKDLLPPSAKCEVVTQDEDHGAAKCLICFDDVAGCRAKTPCGHNEICAQCHVRLRFLHSDKKCPICKSVNDRIIVDKDYNDSGEFKAYDEYEQWGDDIGSNYIFRSDVDMFFTKEYHENVVTDLFSFDCGIPDCKDHKFKNNKQLKKLFAHLRISHKRFLCQLCVDNKRDFVSSMPRMTASELRKHESNGDGLESGFKGHPLCKFCKPKRFYDLMQLHDHLNKDHYKCHLCEKDGKHNQFFKDYQSLNRHFDKEHFLCHDPQCLMARFVVFDSEICLRQHEIDVHGATTRDSRIKFEFKVRRSGFDGAGLEAQSAPSADDFQFGLDGEVFVPEALPNQEQHIQENEPTITDANHAIRTAEIRREAAQIRSQNESQNAFPSLQDSNDQETSNARRSSNWGVSRTNRSAMPGAVTTESFPALGGGTSSRGARRNNSNWGSSTARRTGNNNVVSWKSSTSVNSQATRPRNFVQSRPMSVATSSTSTRAAQSVSVAGGWGRTATQSHKIQRSEENFPSLGSAASSYGAAQALAKKNKKAIISGKKAPTKAAMSNMLSVPKAKVTIPNLSEDQAKAKLSGMKLYLGQVNYKKIKSYTKQFATDSMDPETYILNSAEVFGGISDSQFLEYIPALIGSCPNDPQKSKAMAYLNRQLQ